MSYSLLSLRYMVGFSKFTQTSGLNLSPHSGSVVPHWNSSDWQKGPLGTDLFSDCSSPCLPSSPHGAWVASCARQGPADGMSGRATSHHLAGRHLPASAQTGGTAAHNRGGVCSRTESGFSICRQTWREHLEGVGEAAQGLLFLWLCPHWLSAPWAVLRELDGVRAAAASATEDHVRLARPGDCGHVT